MKYVLTLVFILITTTTASGAGKSVVYQVNGESFEGYYISTSRNAPLVVIIHDWDGLTDYDEHITLGTDPLLADTDADGVNDGDEVNTYSTDPLTSNKADLAPRGSPDGVIDVADYLVLTRLVSGAISPTMAEMAFGDLNDSGGLDAGDLVLMSRNVLEGFTDP